MRWWGSYEAFDKQRLLFWWWGVEKKTFRDEPNTNFTKSPWSDQSASQPGTLYCRSLDYKLRRLPLKKKRPNFTPPKPYMSNPLASKKLVVLLLEFYFCFCQYEVQQSRLRDHLIIKKNRKIENWSMKYLTLCLTSKSVYVIFQKTLSECYTERSKEKVKQDHFRIINEIMNFLFDGFDQWKIE